MSTGGVAPLLLEIASEIRKVHNRLIGAAEEAGVNLGSALPPLTAYVATRAKFVRTFIRARMDFEGLVPEPLFGDATAYVLLDLYASELEGKSVAVNSACIASNGPSTTALRHIGTLVAAGHLIRSSDPTDARRIYLQLAPGMREKIEMWVDRHLDALRLVITLCGT